MMGPAGVFARTATDPAMPGSISKFAVLFETAVIEARDCQVFCSITVPGPAMLSRWPSFPATAMPTSGRLAHGSGLTRWDDGRSGEEGGSQGKTRGCPL